MTPGQGLALEQMEADVAEARRVYTSVVDHRSGNSQAAYDAWCIYVHLLQAYRKEVRRQNLPQNGIGCPACGEELYDAGEDWQKDGYECRNCSYKGLGA